VCKTFGSLDENSPPLDQQLANSAAIVSADNGTYGEGISPDAVKDLRNALLDYEDGSPLSDCLNAIFDLIPADETGWRKWLKRQAEIIEAAINKAKI
jgi:hypothetical protein